MNQKIESRNLSLDYGEDVEVRLSNETGRRIQGRGIVFNKWSKVLQGEFRERIRPDAVDERLLTDPQVISAFQHDPSKIMGRVGAGTLKLTKTTRGVNFEYEAPNTTAGNDLLESVRRGDVNGASFVFRVDQGGEEWRVAEDGILERTITKMKWIGEIGAVVGEAYSDTSVAQRTADEYRSTLSKEDEGEKPTPDQKEIKPEPETGVHVNVAKHRLMGVQAQL